LQILVKLNSYLLQGKTLLENIFNKFLELVKSFETNNVEYVIIG